MVQVKVVVTLVGRLLRGGGEGNGGGVVQVGWRGGGAGLCLFGGGGCGGGFVQLLRRGVWWHTSTLLQNECWEMELSLESVLFLVSCCA